MLNELPNRPYPPELTKKRFSDAVDMYQTFVTQETDRNMVVVNLEACFAGNPNSKAMRKAVMQYLVDKTSTKDLTDGETIAFKKWLNARPDDSGKWMPDFNTMQEAIQINSIALKEEGQKELPMSNGTPDIPGAEVTRQDNPMPTNIDAEVTPIPTHIINNSNQQLGVELNLFFKTPEGFKAHMKIHGLNGTDLLDQGEDVLAWLSSKDWTPEYTPQTSSTAEPTRENLPADGTAVSTFCTIHNCEMKRREKDGQVWYSHKAPDDTWCRGQQ